MIQKKNETEDKIDMNTILLIVICIAIGFIFLSGYLIFDEMYSSKKDCEDLNGIHTIKSFQHLCDDKPFFRYTDGTWGFSNEYNMSTENIPK